MKKTCTLLFFLFFSLYSFSQITDNEKVFTQVEKEAQFQGGADGWLKFMTENLRAEVAANSGAPIGNYTVKVQFIVDKEGTVKNVKAVEVPLKCAYCGVEAMRVLKEKPKVDTSSTKR